jgi:HEAT repeat protein
MIACRVRVRGRCVLRNGVLALSLAIVRVAAAGQGAAPFSDAAAVLEDLGKQVQDQSRSEAERLELIRTLRDWGTAQVRAPLLVVLKDPLPSIRAASANALGWSGNSEAVAALRDRIETPDEASAVRAAALQSLGRIGDDSGRPVVLARIRDPNDEVRGAALWSVTFGSLAKPADRMPFLRQVAEDRGVDLLMRCQAITLLGEAKDVAATELLMRLLEHEPPIPMPLPRDGASQQEVMMVRYRETRDVRAWAAAALGRIEAKTALPLLLRSAEAPEDFFLRLTSVRALVSWDVPAARPVLVRRLDDPFPDTRVAALTGLAKSGDQSVVDAVLARLSDPKGKVRAQAVATLAELGDRRVRPELEALRRTDPSLDVQQALEKALTRLRP